MTKELTVKIDQPPELSVRDVIAQVDKIQTNHAGSDAGGYSLWRYSRHRRSRRKTCLTFRLASSFEIHRQDIESEHRE